MHSRKWMTKGLNFSEALKSSEVDEDEDLCLSWPPLPEGTCHALIHLQLDPLREGGTVWRSLARARLIQAGTQPKELTILLLHVSSGTKHPGDHLWASHPEAASLASPSADSGSLSGSQPSSALTSFYLYLFGLNILMAYLIHTQLSLEVQD